MREYKHAHTEIYDIMYAIHDSQNTGYTQGKARKRG